MPRVHTPRHGRPVAQGDGASAHPTRHPAAALAPPFCPPMEAVPGEPLSPARGRVGRKVVLVGTTGVGKTSLFGAMLDSRAPENVAPTLAASCASVSVQEGECEVVFDIWDTAGQEKYQALNPLYYRNANAVIGVYSITELSSFSKMKKYVAGCVTQSLDEIVVVIAGNKSDLEREREVPEEMGRRYAEDNGYVFFETSARLNVNVDELLRAISKLVVSNPDRYLAARRDREVVELDRPKPPDDKKGKC